MFGRDSFDDAGFFAPLRTDEEIAELIAGDPEPPDPAEVEASRRIRVEELLAAGESGAVDDVLAGGLAALDPADLTTGDLTDLDDETVATVHALAAALDAAPILRELVDYPVTAESLDDQPHAETPKPALAEFVALRDRHPANATAGPSAATAADLDHTVSRATGGPTTRANLAALTRRWHLLKTHGRWTCQRHRRGWRWTGPTGRTYLTQPYDYRLGA